MVFNDQLQGKIETRLSVIGIPTRLIKQLSSLMIKWGQCNGAEWFISRLKALKLFYIKGGSVPSWFAKNRHGDMRGPFGSLYRWSRLSEENFKRSLQVTNAYTVITHDDLTPSQVAKFKDALSQEGNSNLSCEEHRDLALSLRSYIGIQRIDRSEDVSLLTYRGSCARRRPGLSHLVPPSTTDRGVLDYLSLFQVKQYRHLYKQFHSLYSPVVKGIKEESFLPSDVFDDEKEEIVISQFTPASHAPMYPLYGGDVHFLQEMGGKLRSIASPHIIHQQALRHFGKAIYRVVQSLPWDCTFDQLKAVPFVSEAIRCNRLVHSVDLTCATDYFPLDLQITCLRAVFGNVPDIDLFEKISRSYWKSDLGVVQWKKGQPLGLYPSFGSFTLTHGSILWWLNGCTHDNKFFVLGDDVVILDDGLFSRYTSLLSRMSCPWSEQKSLSSSKLSEFAGKIITENGHFDVLKWRNLSNNNFLAICRMLGPRSRLLCNKRQRVVFDAVKHCTAPFGLNFSFPGSNYQKMEALTRQMSDPSLTVVGSLVGLSGVIHKNIYEQHREFVKYDLESILNILTTFDEKVIHVLQSLTGWEISKFQGSPILGGYAGIPEALGNTELPLRTVTSPRVTELQRYLRLLRRKALS
jgi:hypothetical protein